MRRSKPKTSNQASTGKKQRRAPLMMALEPRVMFDGAAAATAHFIHAEHAEHGGHENPAESHLVHLAGVAVAPHVVTADVPAVGTGAAANLERATDVDLARHVSLPRTETAPSGPGVVFIDSRVLDPTSLLTGMAAGTEVVYLNANSGGLQQISAYLSHHHEVSSVSIIAHGGDGDLVLGSTDVNAANLGTFTRTLSDIGRNLRAGADILVYACSTAADARGVSFVDALAKDTGHVVAASSNVTGVGGDWNLEVTTGTVTAAPVLSAKAEAAYGYSLNTSVANSATDLINDIALDNAGLTNDTINIMSNITYTASADNVTIARLGTGTLTIDGNGHTINAAYLSRVLSITSGNVILENVTLENGLVVGNGGLAGLNGVSALGAGISNAGTLTLNNVIVTGNVATGGGAGGSGLAVGAGGGGGSGEGAGVGGLGGGVTGIPTTTSGAKGSGVGGGLGGTTSGGGAGGTPTAGGSPGGAGATATSNGVTAGGGGGGAGYLGSGAAGGSAAGGVYNAGTGKIFIIGSSAITNNLGSGGGGGGGIGALSHGGVGGQGVGGILNSTTGKIYMTAASYQASSGNVGASGVIGSATGGASNSGFSTLAAVNKITSTIGTVNTGFSPPSVSSIALVGNSTNNAASEQFTVTFSEAVTGVTAADFALTTGANAAGVNTLAGAITSVTATSATTYTVTASTAVGDGTLRLDVNAGPLGIVSSSTGDAFTAGYTSGPTFTVEHTAPTVSSVALVGASPNNAASDQYVVTFSEAVTNVNASDFTLATGANAAGVNTVAGVITSVTGSGTTYTVGVNPVTGDGTMKLNVSGGLTGVYDSAGNALAGTYTGGPAYTIDHTSPVATSIVTVGANPNNATSEQFTVTFSENVTGVNASDFSILTTGTAAGTVGAVTGSGSTYTVTVNNVVGTGTLELNLNAGTGIADTAGNAIAGGLLGQAYTVNHTGPAVSSVALVGASPNNATSDQFVVTFSEAVTGVNASDFTLATGANAAGVNTVAGVITSVTGSGTTYTVGVSPVTGDGTLALNVSGGLTGVYDSAGNALAGTYASGPAYTIDHTPPAVSSIATVGTSPNSGQSEQFTVTFSENVTGVDTGDFSLLTTGTVGGSIASVVPVSGKVYTVTVNNVVGNGTLELNLNATGTGIVDTAGNAIVGGALGQFYTITHTLPAVSSITLVGNATNDATSEQYVVNFNENVSGVNALDFSLTKTGTASGVITSVTGSGSTYTVLVNPVAGDGTLRLDLNAINTVVDSTGNVTAGGYTSGPAYTLDHTPPVASSILTVGSNPNNAATESFTFNFSENVTGVTLSDFNLAATGTAVGTLASITGSGSTYTVTATGVTGNGTLQLFLNTSVTGIADTAGNALAGASPVLDQAYVVQHSAPTVTSITTVGANPTNGTSEQFDVTFSEAVNGVNVADFSLHNTGTAGGVFTSVTGSGANYVVTVGGALGDGTTRLDVNAINSIIDAAGNTLAPGGYTGGQTFTVQHTPPVADSIATVGSNPNNASSEQFTVTFSENVTGVAPGDFTLATTGTAAGTIASVTPVSGSVYTVTVNGVTGDGTLQLNLNTSGTGIADAAGNALVGGALVDQAYLVQHSVPVVSSITTVGANPSNAGSEQYDVTFSENVTGVNVGDFSLANTGTAGGIITGVTGSGSNYVVTVGTVVGDGTMKLNLNSVNTVVDSVGNMAAAYTGGPAYTIDHTSPVATGITTVGTVINDATTEQFTVSFSENVTGVTASDFTLVDGGSVHGSIAGVSGSGSVYTVTVNNVSGDGSMQLSLNAAGTGITDLAGNAIVGGSLLSQAYGIEHTAPYVTSITTVGANPTNAASEQFVVNFSENVTGVTAADFVLANTGTAGGVITSVTGSGSTYTVTVSPAFGDGTTRLDFNAGTLVTDSAGNLTTGGYAGGQVYTVEHTPPVATSIAAAAGDTASGSSEQFTVTFSSPVTGVDATDFTLVNTGTVGGTIGAVTGSGTTYTVTVNGVTGNGTLALNLNASGTGITDGAGNAIVGGDLGQVLTIAHTVPAVTSITTVGANPNNASSDQFTVNFSENVTGVNVGDFSLANTGSAGGFISSVTGSGRSYTVTVNPVVGDGTLALNLNMVNTVVDAGGNLALGYTGGQAYTIEHTPPVATSITAAGSNPTDANTETFTVNFSEGVSGVTASDFTLLKTGGVGGAIASVTAVAGSTSSYAVVVNGVTGDGTLQLQLNGSGTGITDVAGNGIVGGVLLSAVVGVDHTAPAVTSIVALGANPTDGSAEQFQVTFSENVTGVNAADFSTAVSGTVAATGLVVTPVSGSVYNVTVGGITGDGTLALNLNPVNTVVDASGNVAPGYGGGQVVTVDHTDPTATSITASTSDTAAATSDQFTVNFSENVTGVAPDDFTVVTTGGVTGTVTAVTPVSGSSYTVTVDGVHGTGSLALDLNASGTGITDTAGNPLSGGAASAAITVASTAPSVTSITPVGSNPSNAAIDQFTVQFSEPVTGVTASDFSAAVTGTVADSGLMVTSVGGTGSTYTVTVNGVTGDGTLAVNLNAGSNIQDGSLVAISGGYSGQPLTVEHTPPSVTSITTVGASPNNAGSDQFTVTFSENVTGVDASDFTAAVGGMVAAAGITVTPVSGSVYTVTVNGVMGDGTLGVNLNSSGTGITDAAGNGISAGYNSGQVYTVEHTPPAVTSITVPSTAPNNGTSETFTVDFSENVTGVTAGDFTLTTTGTAGGTISGVTALGGGSYAVTVAGIAGDGTLRLDLNAGTGITDAAGNSISAGFSTGQSDTVDHTPPVATSITTAGNNPTNGTTETFTVNFSEGVTGVTSSDFTLVKTGGVSGSIAAVAPVAGSTSSYVVTVTGVSGNGTLGLDLNVAGTGITDVAGNVIVGGYVTGQPYVIDHSPPTVTSIDTVGNSTNNASSEQFAVTFSENVTGVTAGDFVLHDSSGVTGTVAAVSGSGSSYSVTVTGVTGDGTMRLDLNGTGPGITDMAGNAVSAGYTSGQTYTIEHTPPEVTSITTTGAQTNNAGTETFTVDFSENVTGVTAGDFVLTDGGTVAGTIASVSPGSGASSNSYTVTVNNVTGDGTMRLDLSGTGAGITDAAGNAIGAGYTSGQSYTIEHTAPEVSSITVTGPSTNNATTETYAVNFSENVTGVTTGDFALTTTSGNVAGTLASVTQESASSYLVTVNNVTGDGTLRLDLAGTGAGITDAAGNAIGAGYTSGQSYTIEHTAPAVSSITTVGASTNNSATETFTVQFSENVSGVTTGDFALTTSGSVAGTIASVTPVTGSTSEYTVVVNNVTGDGTMRLDLNGTGTGIADAAGNSIGSGYTGGQSFTIEHTAPEVSSIAIVGASTNNSATETFMVQFSENVSGVGTGDFVLTTSGSVAGTIASVTPVTGSTSEYTVIVNNVTGDGTMRLDLNGTGTGIADAAGNTIGMGYMSGGSYTIEHTQPAVTSIDVASITPNNAATETFTVNFSESVTGVSTNDFVLTNTGDVAGTIASVSGSGSTYVVTITGVSGNGTMRLDLNAMGTGITDAANNPIAAGYTSGQSYTIEHTGPAVSSIALVGAADNNAATETFTVNFSESVTGVTAGDFVLTNGGSVTGSIASVSGSGSTYTVTVTGVAGDGSMRLDLNASGTGITDAAGNAISGGYTAGPSYTIEHTPPGIASIALVEAGTNNGSTEDFTVTFSEPVTGVSAGDFAVTSGGTVASTGLTVTGSGATYTVSVTGVAGDGTLRLDLNGVGAGISDAAGNSIAAGYTGGPSYVIGHTAPVVSSIDVVGSSVNDNVSEQFTVNFSENVTGVTAGDFVLTNTGTVTGTIASVTGSGGVYTVTVNGVSGEGTMRLDLNDAGTGIVDAAGNAIATGYTSGQPVTLGYAVPEVSSITRVGAAINNGTSEQFMVNFTENVTGVDAGDFVLQSTGTAAGTIASVTGSGSLYTITVNGVRGDGTLRLDLNGTGTGIVDSDNHAIDADFTSGQLITVDHTAPTVSSITSVATSPNNAGTETYTVQFSENVTGVTAGDFVLTNTGTAAGTITSVAGSGSTYTVTVGNVVGDGTLRLDLNANSGNITDTAGNVEVAGYVSGQAVTVDHTPPTVSSITSVARSPNNAGTETYTVQFSENVTGVTAGDFVLTNTGTAAGTITSVAGSGSTYTVTVGNVVGDGTLRLDLNPNSSNVTDTAGNAEVAGYTAGQVVTVEHTAPTVTSITPVDSSPSNATTEQYTVQYSENVTGVNAGGFTLVTTGTAAGRITGVTGSGSTYVVTVSDITGDGTVSLEANSGTGVTDAAGNPQSGGYTSPAGQGVTVEHTPPSVTSITPVSGAPSNGDMEQYTVTFSENVTGVQAGDFALTTTGTASGKITSVSGSGNTYVVTVSDVTGDGTLRVDMNSGSGVTDAAGNTLAGGYTGGQAASVEHTPPAVASVTPPADSTYSSGQTLDYTVTYTEPVVVSTAGGVPRLAITLDNGTVVYAAYVSGSGTSTLTFAYTVASTVQSVGVTLAPAIDLNGGSVTDLAGNTGATALPAAGVEPGVSLGSASPGEVPLGGVPPQVLSLSTLNASDTRGASAPSAAYAVWQESAQSVQDMRSITALGPVGDFDIDGSAIPTNTAPGAFAPMNGAVSFSVPLSSFQFTPGSTVVVNATMANGDALPSWLSFDPSTGRFEGTPPAGFTEHLHLVMSARDQNGREVMLPIEVKFATPDAQGTPDAQAAPDSTRLEPPARSHLHAHAALAIHGAHKAQRLHAAAPAGKDSLTHQFARYGRHAHERALSALVDHV